MSTVIAVLSPKGGCGKSTLATNLARALQLDGYSVLIVDTDRQGTVRDWKSMQDRLAMPAVVGVDRPVLETEIPQIKHAFDFIVVDGVAKAEKMMVSSVKAADWVLIPVQPSAPDIWGVEDLVEIIKTRQSLTDGKPGAAFVVSRQIVGTRLAADAQNALDRFELPILESRTSQRVVFAEAMATGVTALDLEPGGKGAAEVDALREEVQALLNGRIKANG